MFTTVFLTLFFISQYVFVDSSSEDLLTETQDENAQSFEPSPLDTVDKTMRFSNGVVPYYIDGFSYDKLIRSRIKAAMDLIEASSCVIFKQMQSYPAQAVGGSWIHFTNPHSMRECVHEPVFGANGEILIVIGYECMTSRNVLQAVLHGIGFKDEVSHPQRDQYIRIVWQNIQPRFRGLFAVRQQDPQYKLVEYDPMSIMHFHDRAFSINGGPTIAPRIPGLHINPSDKLSQLDVMKLRMWFGHECNKRKVSAVIEKCKTVFSGNQNLGGYGNDASIDVDNMEDPYMLNKKENDAGAQDYENNQSAEVDVDEADFGNPTVKFDARYTDGGDGENNSEMNEVTDYGLGDGEVNAGDNGMNGGDEKMIKLEDPGEVAVDELEANVIRRKQ